MPNTLSGLTDLDYDKVRKSAELFAKLALDYKKCAENAQNLHSKIKKWLPDNTLPTTSDFLLAWNELKHEGKAITKSNNEEAKPDSETGVGDWNCTRPTPG